MALQIIFFALPKMYSGSNLLSVRERLEHSRSRDFERLHDCTRSFPTGMGVNDAPRLNIESGRNDWLQKTRARMASSARSFFIRRHRLLAKTPFVMGGEFSLANLAALDSYIPNENPWKSCAPNSCFTGWFEDRIQGRSSAQGGLAIANFVGWVERSDTHQIPALRNSDGFRCALPILQAYHAG